MNKIIKNLIDKSDIVVRDEKTGEVERFSVTPKDIKEILNDKDIILEEVYKANEEQRKFMENNLSQDIEKELDDFNFAFDGMDEIGLITEFIDQALKRIAHKTAKALEVEEVEVDEWSITFPDADTETNGYNQAVQKFKENKDKYLK